MAAAGPRRAGLLHTVVPDFDAGLQQESPIVFVFPCRMLAVMVGMNLPRI